MPVRLGTSQSRKKMEFPSSIFYHEKVVEFKGSEGAQTLVNLRFKVKNIVLPDNYFSFQLLYMQHKFTYFAESGWDHNYGMIISEKGLAVYWFNSIFCLFACFLFYSFQLLLSVSSPILLVQHVAIYMVMAKRQKAWRKQRKRRRRRKTGRKRWRFWNF